MNREDVAAFVYYKGEVLKRAGLNIIKNLALKVPIFKFFHDTLIAPFFTSNEKIKHENPYMEQMVNNLERKKKEKENAKFEKKFPEFASKYKDEIEKNNSRTIKDVAKEISEILEK